MFKWQITTPKGIKEVKTPQGRHEVSYDTWVNAYKYIQLAQEADNLYQDGQYYEASEKAIESICRIMCALSEGLEYQDLIMVNHDKINNIFITLFAWLQNEQPKKEFIINGNRYSMPSFINDSAFEFMDTLQMLQQIDGASEADKGLIIAAIYLRDHVYVDDLQEIEARKEYFKKHAKMDLFYSCAFFLRSSIMRLGRSSLQLSKLPELELLTSNLAHWVSILYLQALQKHKYSPIR